MRGYVGINNDKNHAYRIVEPYRIYKVRNSIKTGNNVNQIKTENVATSGLEHTTTVTILFNVYI